MNSVFYRKTKGSDGIRGVVRRLRSNRRLLLILLIGIPVAMYVLFGPRGVIARMQMSAEKARLEEEIRRGEEETRRLRSEAKALEGDPKAIEKVARERYGMVKEGETVYRVKREK
jgi:cell division protein FtsB